MYHISDIKKFIRCGRYYFLNINENNAFKPYLRTDESIDDLIIKYLCKDEECFIGVKNDLKERFLNEIDNYNWFTRPRLMDGELRINIPFIHRKGNIYDLYFTYFKTTTKGFDEITISISKQIFEKYGFKIDNIYLIYLNPKYISNGVLDVNELFITTDKYKEETLKEYIENNCIDYSFYINELENKTINDFPSKKCKYCRLNGICEYYDECFPNESKLENDSILTLASSQYKNDMYEDGIRYLKDVDIQRLEGNKVQYAQIMADKNGGIFIDKPALKHFLDKLSIRPISFIDFEWDSFLIPPYKGMKPLGVLCFEYALYYIDENGTIEHRTFVGTHDCRKEFIDGLKMHLPKEGPILAYNAEGAEKLRLKELADIYPEDKDFLEGIIDRFVDLATPFIEGMVYDIRMQGNYTLKKLVDICSDYSYKNLDIYDGMEAVYNWRDVDKGSDDGQKIVDNLKEYCSLDAYGLFLVYKWLVELIVESK